MAARPSLGSAARASRRDTWPRTRWQHLDTRWLRLLAPLQALEKQITTWCLPPELMHVRAARFKQLLKSEGSDAISRAGVHTIIVRGGSSALFTIIDLAHELVFILQHTLHI